MAAPASEPNVIGILGDGQLGRMLAEAAHTLGFRTALLGPGGAASSAGQVATYAFQWGQGYDHSDIDSFLQTIGPGSSVLVEWENVPSVLLDRVHVFGCTIFANRSILTVSCDRLLEKSVASQYCDVPVYAYVETQDDIDTVSRAEQLFTGRLKTCCLGYDGLGQQVVSEPTDLLRCWEALGRVRSILEQEVRLAYELSVIVARTRNGEVAVYEPFFNIHEGGILRRTLWPAPLGTSPHLAAEQERAIHEAAMAQAQELAVSLELRGLLAVEFFVTEKGELLFNEMAPRPHNSGHCTIQLARTSQFEQLVRVAVGIPLGSTERVASGEMVNIISDWPDMRDFEHANKASVHDYGKAPRPGRKLGHVTIVRS